MDHLFASYVQAVHIVRGQSNGMPTISWIPYGDSRDLIKCRLDLTFIRPGKDQLPVTEAGRAQDRIGVLFCSLSPLGQNLSAGDRVVTVSGPVNGTFEVRNVPDIAQDYFEAHHIEVQIIETSQSLDRTIPIPVSP